MIKNKALKQEARGKFLPNALPGALPAGAGPDYKVDLSQASKTSSLPALPSLPTPLSPGLPSLPDLSRPEISSKPIEEEVVEKVIKDEAKKEVEKAEKITTPQRSSKKPLVIFIKGLDLFSSPSKSEGGYAGVGRIAEAVEGSRIYGWDQKEDILEEIRKVHPDFPVILVGHSLGGDTAIEVADELDSLNEGFRAVNLLVTMDAIGFSHDIIPQNVKKHLNIFGENSLFLNDGPHVARREEKTWVRNILSPLDHTDIDDDREIQFEIVDLINKTLKSHT